VEDDDTAAPAGPFDDEVAAAIEDAVDRTGANPDAITVETVERVTWPDGSIGCPEPDQMYTMALVEGYRIVLRADGEELHYHGQDGEPPFHCANPTDPTDHGGRVTQ
jgi:hypothetical protein